MDASDREIAGLRNIREMVEADEVGLRLAAENALRERGYPLVAELLPRDVEPEVVRHDGQATTYLWSSTFGFCLDGFLPLMTFPG